MAAADIDQPTAARDTRTARACVRRGDVERNGWSPRIERAVGRYRHRRAPPPCPDGGGTQAADRYDRRLIIIEGVLIWNVANCILGASESFAEVLFARALLGLGEVGGWGGEM